MEEEEKNKGFKVDDRRRFSAEGELKPEFQGNDQPARAESAHSSGQGAAHAAAERQAESAFVEAPRTTSAAGYTSSPEITFGTFLVGLSTQALVHLGEIVDPQSGQPEPDLIAAEQVIDVLAMLREKTRGNLDRDEDHLLETILFELRMKYVERAREPSR